MPAASRAAPPGRDRTENGFTLIELLVVIVIIGILATIAIPVYLKQRQKAWDGAVLTDLRNASIAQETWLTEASQYTTDIDDLKSVGFKFSDTSGAYATSPASITIVADGANSYCLSAESASGRTIYWDNHLGGAVTSC
jgi:type IV pilus assembly protein PilA